MAAFASYAGVSTVEDKTGAEMVESLLRPRVATCEKRDDRQSEQQQDPVDLCGR